MRENWIDNVIWGFLLFLLIPSGLVVASWNSLPGSRLYNVKIVMEKALVAVAPTQLAKGELEVAYTERRLSEATTLLENGYSVDGLENFRAQAEEAKRAINRAPPGEVRNQLAMKYVTSLQNASNSLEQQKQRFGGQAQRGNPSASQPAVPAQQVVVVNQVTQVVQVIQQINQTQSTINIIITQVEDFNNSEAPQETQSPTPSIAPTPSPSPVKTNSKSDNNERGGSHYRETIKQKLLDGLDKK